MGQPEDLTRLLGRFGRDTIERMGGARDGQLGFGGVGVPRTRILKAQGVGQTHVLFDMDVVTDPRKSLFGPEYEGALKISAALDKFEPFSDCWPRVEGYALNVLTDVGDHAMRSFEFDWFVDCGDSDLCSLYLAEQFQRIGGRTVLQRVRGQDFKAAVWVCRDLRAACFGCAMSASQREEAHHIHSCTRPDRIRPEHTAAALVATQTAAAAHAAQEQWLITERPESRPVNYIVRFDAEIGARRVVSIKRDPRCPHHHPEVIPWDDVQVLSEVRTRSIRPIDLLNEAGSRILMLDRDVVELIACQECDARFRLQPPIAEVVLLANRAGCPACGGDLRALLKTRRVSRDGIIANETLFDLGMPIGHVYRLDSPRRWLAVADEKAELQTARIKAVRRNWDLVRISHAEATAAWMEAAE